MIQNDNFCPYCIMLTMGRFHEQRQLKNIDEHIVLNTMKKYYIEMLNLHKFIAVNS